MQSINGSILVTLVSISVISQLMVVYVIARKVNHPLVNKSKRPKWIYRAILLNVLLPISHLGLLLDQSFIILVNVLYVIGSLVSITSLFLLVWSINSHFGVVFSRNRRFFFELLVILILISSVAQLSISYDVVDDSWIIYRGNFINQLVLYFGGFYLFFELLKSFRLAAFTTKSKSKILFYLYPIGLTLTAIVLLIQENTNFISINVIYLVPLALTHLIFLYPLITSPGVLLLPPRWMTNDFFESLNLPINTPVAIFSKNNVLHYFNSDFSRVTGYSYRMINQSIENLFTNIQVHRSSHNIFAFDKLIELEYFQAEISTTFSSSDLDGDQRYLRLEMIDKLHLRGIKVLIIEEINLIENFEQNRDELVIEMLNAKNLSSKYEPLSAFTRGIIHDFSNIVREYDQSLERINQSLRSSDQRFDRNDNISDAFQTHKNVTIKATSLISQLAKFATSTSKKLEHIEINILLRKIIEQDNIFQNEINGLIVQTDFSDVNLVIYDDRNHVEQIFVNLISNAMEAVENVSDKNVELKTQLMKLPSPKNDKLENYVFVSITDNGPGIPENIKNRIFDPFFTTKQAHRGLGLSICLTSLISSNGYITVNSIPGKTVFGVYLPMINSLGSA